MPWKVERKKLKSLLSEESFSILAYEFSDISHKEQLSLCLCYLDALGSPCEHFIGVVHINDTSSLSLKDASEVLSVSHGLYLSRNLWNPGQSAGASDNPVRSHCHWLS